MFVKYLATKNVMVLFQKVNEPQNYVRVLQRWLVK